MFFNAYNNQKTYYQDFTTEVESTSAEELYGWLGENPQLREWVGERVPKALRENGFRLINKDYEASISVDRNALKDDRYGQVKLRATTLGVSARKGYDIFAARCVEAGTTELCYDGQNFFDTDHSEGNSGTQSNYSASGMALNGTNVQTILGTMGAYKDDQGNPLGIVPTHIMVPTALKYTALKLFNETVVGVTNDPAEAVLKGVLEVIVNPYLSNTGGANAAYYILDLSHPIRPFIFQNRQPMEWNAMDKGDDHAVFWRKEYLYGVDARFVFGYGDWRMAYKAQG